MFYVKFLPVCKKRMSEIKINSRSLKYLTIIDFICKVFLNHIVFYS